MLAGHLAAQAWKQGHLLAPVALVMLATIGSALTVYSAMGNRAEVRDTKVATASLSEAERTRITADLDKTTKLVAESDKWVAAACKSGPGTECKGATFIWNQRKASQKALQAELKETGPIVTPEPKAAQVALLAGLAGYDGGTVKQIVSAVDPLVFPLFLELLAIVLFSFGLGHQARPVVVATPTVEAANDDVEPLPPARMPTQSEVIQWREAFVAKHGRAPRGRELQMTFAMIPKVTAHRWATGTNKPREGREVRRIRAA